MVQYKILRVTDNGGSVAVVVQFVNSGKTAPICFNPMSFEQMTTEEIEQSVAEMVEQMCAGKNMLATATGEINESKVVKVGRYFETDKEDKPIRDTTPKYKAPKDPGKVNDRVPYTPDTIPEKEKPK